MITCIEEQLARDEGRVLKPYRDSLHGLWTIGIGHLLGAQVPPQFEDGISDSVCDQLFRADLNHVEALLDIYMPWWWSCDGSSEAGSRSGVLQNIGFNLGVAGLAQFHTFLAFMEAKEWESAADDLATTAVFKELPDRYGRLRQQILTGEWQ